MYYVLSSREHLLRHFPKGGVGAEIGVAEGNYSAEILASADPKELHLIDPWSHLESGSDLLQARSLLSEVDTKRDRAETFEAPPANAPGDAKYAAVAARFQGDPRVRLHRQYSYKAAEAFEDGSFDFVYLDGNHHYEFVLRDLEDYAAKLKPGGLLFGHDFFEDTFAQKERYGVIDAVGAFVKRSDFCFVLLTWEPFSTFCLARRLDGFAGAFLRNVFESDVQMIEIPDALAGSYQDKMYERRNGSRKRIPSFMNSLQFQLG
ncbi:class I SAM-dependent methyltransferase [Sphingomonas parva]|uniref:class I SAM-dependent methyltransferase n=1 Tax=Sphingomonas parva TaxID=2555898 RepID=UPI001430DA56|nr:class I SAM-dependent methyltransferase [Sphingomonas parva]